MSHDVEKIRTSKRMELIDITKRVQDYVTARKMVEGTLTLFVPHTTAAVTINENTDVDVLTDMILGLSKALPDLRDFRHAEGNSQAHILSSVIGASLSVIVAEGKLVLGTWQGIFFCEFDGPRHRKLYIHSSNQT